MPSYRIRDSSPVKPLPNLSPINRYFKTALKLKTPLPKHSIHNIELQQSTHTQSSKEASYNDREEEKEKGGEKEEINKIDRREMKPGEKRAGVEVTHDDLADYTYTVERTVQSRL